MLATLLAFDAEAATGYRAATLVGNRFAACLVLAEHFGFGSAASRPCRCCNSERAILFLDVARVVEVIHLLLVLLLRKRGLHRLQFRFGVSGAGRVVDDPVEDVGL
ncbi:hypothetical protein WS83_12255 [Burkholderia sp. MSMB2042]|nr:hypothetical protein WS83_12255 [Burkholderia sp. MSMB2042]KVG94102.1 hypothetical protein WS82_07950 [Burkholderia sp. MSMB2041]